MRNTVFYKPFNCHIRTRASGVTAYALFTQMYPLSRSRGCIKLRWLKCSRTSYHPNPPTRRLFSPTSSLFSFNISLFSLLILFVLLFFYYKWKGRKEGRNEDWYAGRDNERRGLFRICLMKFPESKFPFQCLDIYIYIYIRSSWLKIDMLEDIVFLSVLKALKAYRYWVAIEIGFAIDSVTVIIFLRKIFRSKFD